MSRFQAAVLATEEATEDATDEGATEEATDDGATEEATDEATDDGATEDLLEDDGATELGALELVGATVPQPIGWVDTTISSIHTSAERLLKLWKPNIAYLNVLLIQSAGAAPLFQSAPEVME